MMIKIVFHRIYSFIRKLVNKGAIHVLFGSFATKFVTFFGSIFLVRLLSKSEYGILSYYENFLGYFTVFAGLGLAAGIQRYLILADSKEQKRSCLNYALRKGNIWNFILVVACLVICFLYHHPDQFKGFPIVSISLSLCIPFIFMCNLGLLSLRALFDYRRYAYMAVSFASLLVISRVLGAYLGGLSGTVVFRVIAEIVCAAISISIVFIIHFRGIKERSLPPKFEREFSNYSIQLMLTNGLWTIFMLNDLFLLGQLTGNDLIVADYKVAYVIPANLSIITSSICIFVAPYFTKHDKEGDVEWMKSKLKESLYVTMLVIGFIMLLCFLFGEQIVQLIFGHKYLSAVPIMNVLLLASFFNSGIRATLANFLSAVGEQKINLVIAAIGMFLQIVLDLLLIPKLGAIGVGLSSLSVYLLMSVSLVLAVRKRFQSKRIDNI